MSKFKFILTAFILFSVVNLSVGQELKPTNEVRLTYGAASMEQFALLILTTIAGTTIGGIYNENIKDIDGNFIGPVMLQYQHGFMNNRLSLGGAFVYSRANTDVKYESKPDLTFKVNVSFYMLMAQGEFNYIRNKNFQLYSGLSLGLDYVSPDGTDTKGKSTDTQIGPAMQFTPVGIKFGGENFGVNLECGWGSKGLINGGFYTRF